MTVEKVFRSPASTFRSAADVAAEAREEMGVLNEHPGALGLSTGLPSLDEAMSAALEPGRIIVVAGQSSGGKTAFLAQLATSFASQVPVLLCSLEDGARDLIKRQISAMSRESVADVRNGFAGKSIPASIDKALDDLAALDLQMTSDLDGQPTVLDIGHTVMAWKKAHCPDGHGVVIIDQLSHIANNEPNDQFFVDRPSLPKPPPPQREHDVLQWKVKTLRAMAKTQGLTVILAHQLNDQVSDTERPTEKSIRSSRGVLHESDATIAVWVPKRVANPFSGQGDNEMLLNDRGDGHLLSLKSRTIAAFEVPVTWKGSEQRFSERSEGDTKWTAVPAPTVDQLAGAAKLRALQDKFAKAAETRINAENLAINGFNGDTEPASIEPAVHPVFEPNDLESW